MNCDLPEERGLSTIIRSNSKKVLEIKTIVDILLILFIIATSSENKCSLISILAS